jgi:hypothetical protein
MMKKVVIAVLAFILALPLAAETWKGAALMDADCAGEQSKLDNPDSHTRHCALKCADSGYGIVVDKKFVKFDAKGNELAKAALHKSDKKDHLRVTVDGEMKDGMINVSSLTLD